MNLVSIKKFGFCFLLNFSLAFPVFAITIPQLQLEIKKSYLNLNSIQFDYEQLATSPLSTETRLSTGTLYFKKPKFVRIEQKSPEIQWIISNGKVVTLYTPRFNQAVVDTWDRWAQGNLFLMCLSGSLESLKSLEIEYEWTIEGKESLGLSSTWVVRLASPNDKIKLGSVRIWVSEEDYTLRKVEWFQNSLKVETSLKLVIKNPEIKKDLFQFKKESKTDVFYIE